MLETLHPAFQAYWQEAQLQPPTPVQASLFEKIPLGQSLAAISPTGSGKTLAYLLPILMQMTPGAGLQTLIIAPSQELVVQIAEQAKIWGKLVDIKTQAILGSANVKRQLENLKKGPELIVASPGRLLELSKNTKRIKLKQVKHWVLDEADYLLEGDQAASIQAIEKDMDRSVQTIMVSATRSQALQDYCQIRQWPIISIDQSLKTTSQHIALLVQNRQKHRLLRQLSHLEGLSAMVFFDQVDQLDQVERKLKHDGLKVASLHAKMKKEDRQAAIRNFKNKTLTYLLATDLAARGLDFIDLPAVIHYQSVKDARTYFHRSGRTGRMGKEGLVISLVNEQEFRDLTQLLQSSGITPSLKTYYQGQLIDPDDREEIRQSIVKKTEGKDKPKAKIIQDKTSRTSSESKLNQPKKKKDRQRDRKNKGKPKRKNKENIMN